MASNSPKVYILVLNWNNWRDTITCLESIFHISYPNYQVIAIDNGSTDGSEEKILMWAEGKLAAESSFLKLAPADKPISYIRYDRAEAERGGDEWKEKSLSGPALEPRPHSMVFLQTGDDLGYAGGNNIGIRYAMSKGDCAYIWVLNNDTVVDGGALSPMVAMAEADRRIGMVGSKVLFYSMTDTLQTAGGCWLIPWLGTGRLIGYGEKDDGRWDVPLRIDQVNGASMLVKAAMLERTGLMPEDYFLYWDDADWGVRAMRSGYTLMYCPSSRIWHKESATSGYLSPAVDYYSVRNGLYFTRKFYPWFLPLVPFAYLAKHTLVRMARRQPLNFKAYLRGVFDFLRGKKGLM